MSKVIELANKAGIAFAGYNEGIDEQAPSEGQLQYFYTLARADYETKLSAVMPADFKDWHENNRSEWPDIAAWVITNLREQRADLEHQLEVQGIACMSMSKKMVAMEAENAKLRKALSPFVLANSSEEHMTLIVRTADITAARAALGETK